jgi:hypothetical protein
VPPELKLSGAVVAVVPAEGSAGAVAVAAAAAGAGVGQGALRLPKFSTQAQVKRALGDAPHRVLTLSSAVDVFCSFDDAATNQRFDHIMVRSGCESGNVCERYSLYTCRWSSVGYRHISRRLHTVYRETR